MRYGLEAFTTSTTATIRPPTATGMKWMQR